MTDPEVGWPPRARADRTGAVELRKFNILTWLKVAGPSMLRAFNGKVPDEFWSQDVDDDGKPVAVIACVCGAEPKVGWGEFKECECDRTFLWLGDHGVRVARFADPEDGDES